VWARHGKAQAINAGDLLLMTPQLALDQLDVSAEIKWRIHRCLTQRATDTVRGQSAEMELLSSRSFDRTIYERVVEAKTGALISLPVEAVAILAEWNQTEIDALASVFRTIGRLFQMQDDVLDLYGQKGRANRGNDLREGKVSVLVVDHMKLNPDDRSALIRVLEEPRDATSAEDVSFWIERFVERGTLSAVLADIKATSERVLEQPALRRLPGLYAVTDSLVERMLAPIGHLFPERKL
jgi:geranylgeranyl diphosphate synthase type I